MTLRHGACHGEGPLDSRRELSQGPDHVVGDRGLGQIVVTIELGNFELDDVRLELRRGGERVAVQPKVARLLAHLAKERARTVPSEELLRVVWPDEKVTVASVKRAIRGARIALGDTGGAQSSIRTVRGCGYQLVVPIRVDSRAEPSTTGAPALAVSKMATSAADSGPAKLSEYALEDLLRLLAFFGVLRDVIEDDERPAPSVGALSSEKICRLLALARHPAAESIYAWLGRRPETQDATETFSKLWPYAELETCAKREGETSVRLRKRNFGARRVRIRR